MARSTPHNFTQGQVSPSVVRPKNFPGTVQFACILTKMCAEQFSGKLRCYMAIHSPKYRKQYLPAVPALLLHSILLQSLSWQSIAIVSSYHTETSEEIRTCGITAGHQRASPLKKSAGIAYLFYLTSNLRLKLSR